MIQSVSFGQDLHMVGPNLELNGKNTYDDWKLLAVERPVIAPPTQKTNFVDIPGGNGGLDFSEALTGYPVYNNRESVFKFRVLNVGIPWNVRYSEIMRFIHGKNMKIILNDEPEWFYYGRCAVEEWESAPTWSIIAIKVNVGPYKWYIQKSTDPWLWNSFNFLTGVISDHQFANIVLTSTSSWRNFTFNGDLFGTSPLSPIIIGYENPSFIGVKIRFVNNFLNIDVTRDLSLGRNEFPEFICYGAHIINMSLTGIGKVDIEFRKGIL